MVKTGELRTRTGVAMEALFGVGWAELEQEAVVAVVATVLAPFIRGSNFYWPFLLASLAIAVLVFLRARPGRERSLAELLRAGLDRRIWAAPSAKADYRYYLVNTLLHTALMTPLIVSSAWVGLVLSDGLTGVFGPIEAPVMRPVAIKLAYTVAFFLGWDFGHFVSHYLQHRVPLLWEFHKVHHSAQVLTPITATRLHPVDLFLMTCGRNLGAGLASGVFFYLGAGEVGLYSFLGMHALLAVYQMIGHLRHSMLWVSYGPLNGILISPAHHQIHHSALLEHRDMNHGFALTLWDRLFGTFYAPPETKPTFPMGIGDGSDAAWHRVGRMYVWPLVNAVRVLRSRETLGSARADQLSG